MSIEILTHTGSTLATVIDALLRPRSNSVGVNDRGYVVGVAHHRSKLSDHEVDLVHDLRMEGLSYSAIAGKMSAPRNEWVRVTESWAS